MRIDLTEGRDGQSSQLHSDWDRDRDLIKSDKDPDCPHVIPVAVTKHTAYSPHVPSFTVDVEQLSHRTVKQRCTGCNTDNRIEKLFT
jgi:hypothetical protein